MRLGQGKPSKQFDNMSVLQFRERFYFLGDQIGAQGVVHDVEHLDCDLALIKLIPGQVDLPEPSLSYFLTHLIKF